MFPRPLRPSSGGRPGRTVVVGLLTLGVLLVSGCTGGDEPTSTSEGMFAENKAGTAVQDLVGRAGSGRVSDVTITNDEVRLTTDQGAVFIQPSQGEVYTTRAAGEADAPTFDATAWDLAALGDQLRAKTPPTCPGAAVGRLRPLVVDRPVLELSCPDPNQRPVWLEPDGSELPDLDLTEPTDLATGLAEQQENIEGGVYSVSSFTTDGRQRIEVVRKDGDKAVRITRYAAYRPTLDQLYETLPWERPADFTETFQLSEIKPDVVADTAPEARAKAGAAENTPAEITIVHPKESDRPLIRYIFGEDDVWFSLSGDLVDDPV